MKRVISFILAIVILCSSFAGLAVTASAADDYPYRNGKIDAMDEWYFYTRECTSFCAWRINHNNGLAFTNFYGGVQWGNAGNWGKAAKSIGVVVDMKPAVGAIAWWSRGHVAWVKAVNNNKVTVEEYNWTTPHCYNTRTFDASSVSGYIHLACIGHIWNSGKVTKKATCTAEGVKTYTCTVCGKTTTKAIAKIAHTYKTTVVKPTATKLGYTVKTCTVCGKTTAESDYTAPTAGVSGFKCTARTVQAQTVAWNKVSTATGYQVQVSNAAANKWEVNKALTGTSYTFKNLSKAGNNYKFRVRYYIKGEDGKNYFSPWSKTLNSPTLPRTAKLTKTTGDVKAFTAQWNKQPGVTGYQVQYSTDASFAQNSAKVTVKKATTLSKKVTGLKAGTKYYVRVRTYKNIGGTYYFSIWGNVLEVSTVKPGSITDSEVLLESDKEYTAYDITGDGKRDKIVCKYERKNHSPTISVYVNGKKIHYEASGAKGLQAYLLALSSEKCYIIFRAYAVHGANSDTFYYYAGGKLVKIKQDSAINSNGFDAHGSYKRIDNNNFSAVISSGYYDRCLVAQDSKALGFILKFKVEKNAIKLTSRYGDARQVNTYRANRSFKAYETPTAKTAKYTVQAGEKVTITQVYLEAYSSSGGYEGNYARLKAKITTASGSTYTCWIIDGAGDYNAPLLS